MDDVDFTSKPGRDQLESYVGTVAWLAFEASRQAREAQVQVLNSKSPEQLAAAVTEIERHTAENAAGWARLAEQIRSWS
jgi:cytochrome c-type biogenesis protein CcmH/NrfG